MSRQRLQLVRPTLTDEADERPWVERAQEGDARARATLFERHAPRLVGLLTRLLQSTADAEDAIQDTFVIAFSELPRLRDAGAFGGWVRQIAVHQAQRRFRRRRLQRLLGLDRPLEDATLAKLADPGATPELRAELGELDRLLATVPAKDRLAWMLRHVEGYELAEVAQACDCSLATAKRRVAAAQARISRHLEIGEFDHE
jgi:RNA polymerase sigma-70 factor (ECF subfamily)